MQAELQYKKREKKIAPTGWEAFNQKALYEAYEKRTSNIPYSQEVGIMSLLLLLSPNRRAGGFRRLLAHHFLEITSSLQRESVHANLCRAKCTSTTAATTIATA